MASMQIWRHRPSGNHYLVYVSDGQAVRAKGPMTPKEAAALTAKRLDESESDTSVADTLNAAPWEYDPVWQDEPHREEDAEWLRGIIDPADDSTV